MNIGTYWQAVWTWAQHLDWGNVPSWASAGSLAVAAAVFVRDRRRHQRRQIDEVMAWGDIVDVRPILLDDDTKLPPKDLVLTAPRFKNSSKLPVRDVIVNYTILTHWRDAQTRRSYFARFTRVAWHIDIVEPDKTAQPKLPKVQIAPPPNGRAMASRYVQMSITHVYVRDSAGKIWVCRPNSGRPAIPIGLRTAFRHVGAGIGRKTQI
ncbi:hypothetical protein [Amycolatopsis sp. NPDC051071]|uniref:hypothetical protein n=1 Tax=Amycolatopsis sp. NPDC051071 TaxID=3154637 RepID=UPI003445C4D9